MSSEIGSIQYLNTYGQEEAEYVHIIKPAYKQYSELHIYTLSHHKCSLGLFQTYVHVAHFTVNKPTKEYIGTANPNNQL